MGVGLKIQAWNRSVSLVTSSTQELTRAAKDARANNDALSAALLSDALRCSGIYRSQEPCIGDWDRDQRVCFLWSHIAALGRQKVLSEVLRTPALGPVVFSGCLGLNCSPQPHPLPAQIHKLKPYLPV